jgi:hypothetical protein
VAGDLERLRCERVRVRVRLDGGQHRPRRERAHDVKRPDAARSTDLDDVGDPVAGEPAGEPAEQRALLGRHGSGVRRPLARVEERPVLDGEQLAQLVADRVVADGVRHVRPPPPSGGPAVSAAGPVRGP